MSERRREVRWSDPRSLTAAAAGRSGLEFLRAMARGDLPRPPIGDLLDFGLIEVEEGRVVFEGRAAEPHLNPLGALHGGYLATLLDSAMSCAVYTTLPAGASCPTLELHVNFVRALNEDAGCLRAEGRMLHRGSRTATAEGRLTDPSGRLCAHGTTTLLLLGLPEPR
jgi:uncharacterized protein (TIGR00369 family)